MMYRLEMLAGFTSLALWTLAIVVTLASCGKCADLRESNPNVSATPYNQLAHVCFASHSDLAAAIATGKIDPSRVTSARVCLKNPAGVSAGATCPQN